MIGPALGAVVLSAAILQAEPPGRITVLYDAFGAPSALERDWGFAALVEYGGRRILFDTGNDAAIFERNVKAIGADLTKLDAVLISHRHGDYTTGLGYLLEVNPGVRIFAPQEGAYFKSRPPKEFLAPYPSRPLSPWESRTPACSITRARFLSPRAMGTRRHGTSRNRWHSIPSRPWPTKRARRSSGSSPRLSRAEGWAR